MKKLNEARNTPYTLVGCDGNAFSVMAYVQKAMRQCGKSRDEINGYIDLAKQGDYNNLLLVSMEILDQLNDELGFTDADYDDMYDDYDNISEDDYENNIYESMKRTNKKSKRINEDNIYYDVMVYDAKKILNNAISDALIKIWDECGYEFSKDEAEELLHSAVDNFKWEHFSLYNFMPKSIHKNVSESEVFSTDINDIKLGNIFHMSSPDYLTRNSRCLYLDDEFLTDNDIDIDEIAEYISENYDLDVYIINNSDIQVIFNANKSLTWLKVSKDLQKTFNLQRSDLMQRYYDKEDFLKR